ncbi:hypothetical protein J3R30DRAFT_3419999 [Lentinula aciculospora]|uniref:COP9 signalosome complex subunit 3 N-terminal helical repeats domain-containing protein n=1 Tax=Lentinula aciculospora TaxID=153920 RepID=A0A9W9ATI8_9AGAR|nr:hypothetical protein J3R30DRAFT_3419999 [Lentinula aciculospora]
MALDSQSIDGLVQQITTSDDLEALAHTLRTPGASGRDVREFILASSLSSGQDPLSVLDLRINTLGVLYILSARLNIYLNAQSGVQRPPWAIVRQFCEIFDPEQARLVPERMVMFAKSLTRYAQDEGNLKLAIPLLYSIVTRLPSTHSTLTPIHPILLLTTLQTRHITPEISRLLIEHPIDNLFMYTSIYPDHNLSYNDNLIYHYLGGVILTKTGNYTAALDYFETALTAPSANNSPPAGIQLEALKKLRLVQCIALGGPQALPKYTSSILTRIFKSSPYQSLINSFPGSPHPKDRGEGPSSGNNRLKLLVSKDRDLYSSEGNLGLVELLVAAAPKWIIKRLTETYVTLGLAEIGKYVGIDDEQQVRALVLNMIESRTILATISDSGIVTFHDAPGTSDVNVEDMRALLGALPSGANLQTIPILTLLEIVQTQSAHLANLDMDIGRSKEFISKALKASGGSSGIMAGPGPGFGPGGSFPDEDEYPTPGMYAIDREDSMMFG